MRCPKCHNENKIDALTCDFCMTELPMTEERKKQISELRKKERQNKMHNSMVKLFGLLLGLVVIVGIVVAAFILKK